MRQERIDARDPRVTRALAELRTLIQRRYPQASFEVFRGEDPDGMYLRATVDVEDPDEVMDVVVDRLFELQVEEELPVYVLPAEPLTRVAEEQRSRATRRSVVTLPPLASE